MSIATEAQATSIGTVAGVPITVVIPAAQNAALPLVQSYLNGVRLDNTCDVIFATESRTIDEVAATVVTSATVAASAVTADAMVFALFYVDVQ